MKNFTLIIGAMKSGTTSLFNYLIQHPEICGSIEKEPMFFSRHSWEDGIERYVRLWPSYDSAVHRTALEASTEYSKTPTYPNCAVRVEEFSRRYNATFKFIYVVRDPLKMIDSGLRHGQDAGWGSTRQELFDHLLTVADYAKQLDLYYERFPASSMLIIKFEDLVESPGSVLRSVVDFLRLDRAFSFRELGVIFNSKEQRRRAKRVSEMGGRLEHLKVVKAVSYITPAPVRRWAKPLFNQFAAGLVRMENQHIVRNEWRLTVPERRFIQDRLGPSMKRLSNVYRVDISSWDISGEAVEQ